MATIDRRGATVSATDAPASSTPNADLAIKTAVRVATTGSNINLQTIGLGVVDGVTLVAGDRVLVKDQTDATQNGIYNASTGVWAMSSDFQNNSQVASGLLVAVNAGTLNTRTVWALSATDPVVLGTTQLSFISRISNVSTAAYAVVQPSSGNFQGAGYPISPQYLRSDQNARLSADVIELFSSDPSAVALLTLGGTVTAGDVVTLRFIYGVNNIGVSYTAQSGDTLAHVVNGLVSAIANNSTLFSLNGWSSAGGAFTAPSGVSNPSIYGGYAGGALVGYVVPSGNSVAFDYDSTVNLSMSYTVTGAATESVTFAAGFHDNSYLAGGSTVSTSYQMPNAWDNNPALVMSRAVTGKAPPAGSVIFALYATGADSASSPLGTRNVNYGNIAYYVGDSTSGHLQGAWILQGAGGGAFYGGGGGAWVGQGLYMNFGGAPFYGGLVDKGPGTINSAVYYVNGAHSIQEVGATFQLNAAAGFALTLGSNVGVGVNASPSAGLEFNSALGFFVTGGQTPTTGTGISISYNAGAANIQSKNFASAAYQLLNLQGSEIGIQPSGSATSGLRVQANALIPAADNATQTGSSLNRWSSFHSLGANLYGATSGNILLKAAAIAGSNTLTLPAGTTDFSATGGTSQVVKQTSAGGAFTVAQLAFSDISGQATLAQLPTISNNTLLGNSSGGAAVPAAQTLGATLAFSGGALQTTAHTGDVTTSANSFVTTVAKIAGTTVSGTTGTGNVAFSASPTFTGLINGAAMTLSGQLQVSYASPNFTLLDSGTSFAFFQIQNGAGTNQMRVGAESAAGGALFAGSSGLAGVIGMTVNQPFQIFTNNALRINVFGGGGVAIGGAADPSATNLAVAGVYKVDADQVVGNRITGYTAMTGSPDKATAYATSTVTLPQLAGRVAQLQADLTTHGLIGA